MKQSGKLLGGMSWAGWHRPLPTVVLDACHGLEGYQQLQAHTSLMPNASLLLSAPAKQPHIAHGSF